MEASPIIPKFHLGTITSNQIGFEVFSPIGLNLHDDQTRTQKAVSGAFWLCHMPSVPVFPNSSRRFRIRHPFQAHLGNKWPLSAILLMERHSMFVLN